MQGIPSIAQDLAESFINGNISYVKARVNTREKFIKVLEAVKELYPEEEANFIRLMK